MQSVKRDFLPKIRTGSEGVWSKCDALGNFANRSCSHKGMFNTLTEFIPHIKQ